MLKHYCPLPFRHAFVDSSGISACCMSPRHKLKLEDWATHPPLLQMQQELLNDIIPNSCTGCHRQERTQGRSLRTDSLLDYNNQVFTETTIDFVDYRSSNICNFKCRSCDPQFSHGIAKETRTHNSLKSFYKIIDTKTVSVTENNHKWIIDNLGNIKRLMFTGGEPTVIPEIKNIINEIIKNYSDKISVLITSNASFTDKFWFDITQQLPNLHWTISIDAIGPASKIIRHGTKWETVESNARWLAKNANSLDINSVITNLNIFQLIPLLKFGRELQLISISPNGQHGNIGCRHQFHISQRPYILSPDNLSPELKTCAIEYLTKCKKLDLDPEQTNMINGLLKQIEQSDSDIILWNKNQQFNQALDIIRNEDHTTLFNESS